MFHKNFYWLIFCSLVAASLQGEETEGAYVPTSFNPFSVSGEALAVSGANFYTPSVKGQKLHYAQADVAFGYTQPVSECGGWLLGAEYVATRVAWAENPDFDEKLFNYVSFSAGAFTTTMTDWFWSSVINVLMDTQELDLVHYALYQGILWGKYKWCDWITFHGGFIVEAGLNKGKIWPIIGFEWAPYPELWQLHVIYPVDISFKYFLTSKLALGASLRFLRDRHRVGDDEPLPQGIFEYLTTGGEGDLIYKPFKGLSLTAFAGSTFGGDLKITNHNNNNATHYKFNGSFYGGGSAALNF